MKKKHQVKKRLAAGALIAGMVAVGSLRAGAAPITVLNSDFTQSTSHSSPFVYSTPNDWNITGLPWLASPYTSQYAVSGGAQSGTTAVSLAGQYAGGANVLTISQQTTAHAAVGDTFTLTVAVGDPLYDNSVQAALSQVGDIALTINGVIVAENSTLNDPNFGKDNIGVTDPDFRTYIDGTATFTLSTAYAAAHPSLVNGIVGVELLTPTKSSYYYNNVRLDVESVPEPSTWALMFAGLLSLVGLSRIKRKA